MLTLEEIAKLAHVSRSTVSRVINNDPNVSSKTLERVRAVIQQHDFQPNQAARRLAGGRTRVLGLVIPMGVARLFTDPYFSILIQGVSSACNSHDHSVMLWLAEPEYERRMINQIFNNRLIDGVIVSSMMINDPVVRALIQKELPFILIGRHPLEDCACYVDVDNHNSAREAVAYLLRRGRSRVATITGPNTMVAATDRLNGYLAALKDRGLVADPQLIVDGDFSETGGYHAAQQLLPHHPDAVFAASDPMAIGALRAIHEAGLRVPEDIALVGFDDIPQAAHTNPPLTTVRQHVHRLGETAVETLIAMIENPDNPPRRIVLPTEFIIRATT